MTVSFEVDEDFLRNQGLGLAVADLDFGFAHGWIDAATVVDVATEEVRSGADDPGLVRLASILRDELADVPDLLSRLSKGVDHGERASSKRKWLYLQLSAAYQVRADLADPLGVVEQLYTDFDYPESMDGFVRYMPLRDGDEAGEPALLERWRAFLAAEHQSLTTGVSERAQSEG